MREYYSRLFGDWKEFRLFGKGQIVVGLAAAVIQIIREGQTGAIAGRSVLPSIEAAVLGYLAVCVLRLGWISITTPVNLDHARADEIEERKKEVTRGNARITQLEEVVSRKHPHDEHLETQVCEALSLLSDKEREFIACLLDRGRIARSQVHTIGFSPHTLDSADQKTLRFHLLVYEPHRPGNGLVEMDRFYEINPKLISILRDVLHPPIRPVTPTQS